MRRTVLLFALCVASALASAAPAMAQTTQPITEAGEGTQTLTSEEGCQNPAGPTGGKCTSELEGSITGNPITNPDDDRDECTIEGNGKDNELRGTDERDVICGMGGDDIILGMGGNDIILGGGGEDTIQGGNGDDTIRGGKGGDTIQGNDGRDKLYGNGGPDTIQGGDGKDTVRGGAGDDTTQQ